MSPAPDRTRLVLLIALIAVAVFLIAGRAAAAESEAGWGWPLAEHGSTLLGFGDHYEVAGQSRTHTGVDLAASEGDEVLAPVSATVSFVGDVPSGPDRRQKAVTIDTVTGQKLTLMPLERVSVARGDKVRPGETLARVAAEGDGSDAAVHLHVSLRKGSLYVDPLASMVAPGSPASQEPAPDPQPQPQTRTAPAPSPAPAAVAAAAAAPLRAGDSAPAPADSAASLAEHPTPSLSGDAVSALRTRGSAAPSTDGTHARATVRATQPAAVRAVADAASVASAATRDVVQAAASADLTPRQVFSLADLARVARTRDRLVVTVVSYLLATIAASGLIAWAVRPRDVGGLEPASVVAHSD
jgi:hypothetical protein